MFNGARRMVARGLRGVSTRLASLSDRVKMSAWQPSAEQRRLLVSNRTLKDAHKGRPAFVIGNGPSLAGQDLEPLADQVTFVANGFWRHPLMEEAAGAGDRAWQPTYYSIVDPLYFDGSPPMLGCFETIRRRATGCTFLIPLRYADEAKRKGLLAMDRVRACLFRGGFSSASNLGCDLTGPIPHPPSVSVMGLLAALYTGCNPIYLLGMDHDWLSRPVIQCDHFYQQVSVLGHPKFEAIERGGAETYLENLEAMTVLYRGYRQVRELAEAMGVVVYNATRDGFLDAFPRVSYEDIVPGAEGNDLSLQAMPPLQLA